ncbi:MAG: ribosylpyrimidine nucleosidase [Bacillota bacterium]|jgi:inosine-uridine nucleoside N-ribohydrolase|nr:ribosylpyrimidine nucleosidase [Bacillota bacterium]
MKRKIILDIDPGHDDAVALLIAAASPELELVGITTVAGNQTLEKTTLNARRVATVAGIKVPIYAGLARPLVRDQVIAPNIHGESGLDGPDLPAPEVPVEKEHAVDFIIRTLDESDGDITLVPTGPLTNIAAVFIRRPDLARRVKEIVLMGGAYGLGNVTPAAEFNIYADPEAAHVVFTAGAPITMVGLDLTHQATATPDVLERLRGLRTRVGDLVAELLTFFGSTYHKVYGMEAPPVHDPCTVAKLIDPDVFTTRPAYVAVDTKSDLNYGRTVCDFYGLTGHAPNAQVAMKLDRDRFWDIVLTALARYR